MDEAYEQIVRWHFVCDARRTGRSKPSHFCKIACPNLGDGSGIKRRDAIRIRKEATGRALFADDILESCQLARAEDAWMAREDLLNKRGARAWHANDKYRQM